MCIKVFTEAQYLIALVKLLLATLKGELIYFFKVSSSNVYAIYKVCIIFLRVVADV